MCVGYKKHIGEIVSEWKNVKYERILDENDKESGLFLTQKSEYERAPKGAYAWICAAEPIWGE